MQARNSQPSFETPSLRSGSSRMRLNVWPAHSRESGNPVAPCRASPGSPLARGERRTTVFLIQLSNSQASSAGVLSGDGCACLFFLSLIPRERSAVRRTVKVSAPLPKGVRSLSARAACVTTSLANNAENARAQRRSTGGDFWPRVRASGRGKRVAPPLIRRLTPPCFRTEQRPAIEGGPT